MTQIWKKKLFLPCLTHFVSINELTDELNQVLDEGDSAALLQDTFENLFRDMFLNVTHKIY